MKDIDFDELDRAVNSLMGGVPKTDPGREEELANAGIDPVSSTDENEPEQTHVAPVINVPEPAHDEPQAAERPKPLLSVTPPARQRGQFMDMVRPAASDTKNQAYSRPVSRQGLVVQPSASSPQPGTPSTDNILQPPQPKPEQPSSSSPSDWPDPLESVDFNKTTEAVTVRAANTGSLSMQTAPPSPMSPFLRDTKVEKRPLGRQSDVDTSLEAASEPSHAPVLGGLVSLEDETSDEAPGSGASDTVPKQPLPLELGHDVMAIEADTGTTAQEPPLESSAATKAPLRPSAAGVASALARTSVASIPQQYRVQPSVSEPTSGAIYDTAAYPQPLSHPAKKKPGWLILIVLILILLLGAGSGAAVYYLGLV